MRASCIEKNSKLNINKEFNKLSSTQRRQLLTSLCLFSLNALGLKSLLAVSLVFQKIAIKIDVYQLPQYPFPPAGSNAMAMIPFINLKTFSFFDRCQIVVLFNLSFPLYFLILYFSLIETDSPW